MNVFSAAKTHCWSGSQTQVIWLSVKERAGYVQKAIDIKVGKS